ncbi:hypothetical protein EV384_2884 [Micromonospora kangleipakensis]|uniref:Barstar (Barnase inhibitor) n=2 Tax=Micromonospora kangleipakensis TaxID=1077942 RepID=A0A4Q8B9K2_9ACTN|nr:hypothetical protein EV384_2884 [Micromonospora kangleipakensis]
MIQSPVRLVHSRALLSDIVAWLRRQRYHVVSVDASWLITSHMFRDLGSVLGYTCHDQWHCLSEGLAETIWETLDRSAGFTLVLTGFDVFATRRSDDAQNLLEVVGERAWPAALQGKRVMCLVQSDDPGLELRRLGLWLVPWVDTQRLAGLVRQPPFGIMAEVRR